MGSQHRSIRIAAAMGFLAMVLAPIASASLIAIGPPIESNSWIQRFEYSLDQSTLGPFDEIGLEIFSNGGGGPFEDPYITDFSHASWGITGMPVSVLAEAEGDATEALAFNVHFEGDLGSGVVFALTSYYEGTGVERIRAGWNGSSWLYTQDHLREDPVPEPATLLLSGIGLSMAAASEWKRRRRCK